MGNLVAIYYTATSYRMKWLDGNHHIQRNLYIKCRHICKNSLEGERLVVETDRDRFESYILHLYGTVVQWSTTAGCKPAPLTRYDGSNPSCVTTRFLCLFLSTNRKETDMRLVIFGCYQFTCAYNSTARVVGF